MNSDSIPMNLKFTLAFFYAVSICGASPIDPVYFLQTGHTGAQTQIDVNHTSTWTFTPTIDFQLGGGILEMKAGHNTSEDITLDFWQGPAASGTPFASITLSHTEFCAGVTNCGQFTYHQFAFTSPLPLLVAGTTYFAALTSLAPDVQSKAYFIKADSYISDANGDPVDPQPIVSANIASAPEPGTFVLIGLGLITASVKFRRKKS